MSYPFQEGDIVNVKDQPLAKVIQAYGDYLQVEFLHDSDLKLWVKPSDISGVSE